MNITLSLQVVYDYVNRHWEGLSCVIAPSIDYLGFVQPHSIATIVSLLRLYVLTTSEVM